MKHTIKNIINIKDIYLWTYYITLFAIKTFLLSSCLLVTYPLFLHKPIVPLRLVNYPGIYLFFCSYVGSLAAQSLIIYTKSALHCRFMWESRTFMKINNWQLTAELKPEPSESEFLLGRITLSLLLLTKKPTAYLSLLHGEEGRKRLCYSAVVRALLYVSRIQGYTCSRPSLKARCQRISIALEVRVCTYMTHAHTYAQAQNRIDIWIAKASHIPTSEKRKELYLLSATLSSVYVHVWVCEQE